MLSSLARLDDSQLVINLRTLVQSERKTTAQILDYIQELDRRRLYLGLGYTSTFSFLTQELGYSAAAAQRRIDGARLLRDVPTLKSSLSSGEINLMQVSLVAQSVRQKVKESPQSPIGVREKMLLLESVKGQDVATTQTILTQRLDLPMQSHEKARMQKDESVRLELTLSKTQMQQLKRVKEILSHSHPGANLQKIIEVLTADFLKRKDPARKKAQPPHLNHPTLERSALEGPIQGRPALEGNTLECTDLSCKSLAAQQTTSKMEVRRAPIPLPIRKLIHRRDQSCQWRDAKTGKRCASRFQLQVDHIHPVWRGGGNEATNLQLLCASHNRYKFRCEIAAP